MWVDYKLSFKSVSYLHEADSSKGESREEGFQAFPFVVCTHDFYRRFFPKYVNGGASMSQVKLASVIKKMATLIKTTATRIKTTSRSVTDVLLFIRQ